jgi:hypothetical protein
MTVRFPFPAAAIDAAPAASPPPDLLDLYAIFAEAGLDLTAAAVATYAAHRGERAPPETTLAAARSAAARVLRTLAEYDAERDGGAQAL